MASLFIPLAACLAAACGDEAGAEPDATAPAGGEVELGTGTTAFEPLRPESDLVLVAGPQGGHHFVVHARIRDLLPGDPERPGLVDNPSTRFGATSESGEQLQVDMAPYRLGYAADGDVHTLTSGRILVVREAAVPSMYQARVQVTVEVTDSAGATARDERWVVAVEGPAADAGPGGPAIDAAPPL